MRDLMDVLRAAGGRAARRTLLCSEPACGACTAEGKPYCSAHIERLPYVRGVLDGLRQMEYEAAAVSLDPTAPAPMLEEEMLQCVGLYSHQAALYLMVPHEVVVAVAVRLARRGALHVESRGGRSESVLLCLP